MSTTGTIRAIAGAGLLIGLAATPAAAGGDGPFRRIASFPVFLNTSVEQETSAETIAAANGGNLLVYTDSPTGSLGFIDITDPADPQPAGVLALPGEPTSVAVSGDLALVAVNTSVDFVNTSGDLLVVELGTRQIVRTIPLGGQPDAVAVSPDGQYAAVAIENERDEDLGDGAPPQLPAGYVVIVDLVGQVADWTTRVVDLVGVADLFPEDPEPEFVDINAANIAVVTLQENNHIVLIQLSTGLVINDFPAGTVDLVQVDTVEDDLIQQVDLLNAVPREPDAVAWTSALTFTTADEGDLFGGSRGFTNFVAWGFPVYRSGNTVEHLAARLGHYPEGRSENKGTEPEGAEYGEFGGERFLFIGSERANLVLVYELDPTPLVGETYPVLRQVLPSGVAPEGLLAIPDRGLFVVACEADDRDDTYRSTVQIYELTGQPNYPTIVSVDRPGTAVPIPWAALSGLATDPLAADRVYSVYDSFYRESRVFGLDVSQEPAVITDEVVLRDTNGALINLLDGIKDRLPGTDDYLPADLVNDDGSVNLDPEGVAATADGGFWIASEGTGNLDAGVSDPDDRPFERPNLLLRVAADGTILRALSLPIELVKDQLRFGFEGVAQADGFVYVAFQRAWGNAGDPADRARIGRLQLATGAWTFAYYPLDAPTSPNGGWVGLSELTWLGGDDFAVIERDNQGNSDARVKRVYSFSIAGVDWKALDQVPAFDVLSKTLELDLLAADAYGPTGGPVPEKQEGMAVLADGTLLIVNDNDGVDDNSGETQLLRIGGGVLD